MDSGVFRLDEFIVSRGLGISVRSVFGSRVLYEEFFSCRFLKDEFRFFAFRAESGAESGRFGVFRSGFWDFVFNRAF